MTRPDAARPTGALPGLEMLQQVMSGVAATPGLAAGAAPPWLLPTLDLDELDKRIRDLKAVQFWLEQNGRMLGATIQTLEVQRLTLATLQGLKAHNVDLSRAWPPAKPPAAPAAATAPAGTPGPDSADGSAPDAGPEAPTGAAGLQQAMQWWSQLTEQFGQIASATAATASDVAATLTPSDATAAPRPARKRARRSTAGGSNPA